MKTAHPRILLYSHDGYGLGHFRRCLSIGGAIGSRLSRASVLCVTGSPRAHEFLLPPNFDYVKLPSVTKDDDGRYAPRSLALRIEEVRRMRERILFETVMNFAPDLVLVDHAPAGMEGEMARTLRQLRAEQRGVKLLLGLRDVVDTPEAVKAEWERLGVPNLLSEVYDRILVYGMKDVFDVPEAYGFSDDVRRKTRFTGYIYRNGALTQAALVRRRLPVRTGRLVVASVGGGGDGQRILKKLLEGIERHPPAKPYDLLIVTGPLMSDRKRACLEGLAARSRIPARVERFLPDLLDHVRAADLVVGMAGYNSLIEALALKRPVVVVPRVFPRREQQIRAKRFEELGLVTAIDPLTLRASAFARAVEDALDGAPNWRVSRARGAMRLDFSGLDRVTEAIIESLPAGSISKGAINGSIHRSVVRTTEPTNPV